MIRHWSPVLVSLLLLAACSSGGSSTKVVCQQQFWNGTFGTCLPSGWKVLSSDTLKGLGVPEETVAAFQMTDATGGQFNTVTVTAEPLAQPMTTTEYSQANVVAVSALPEYKLLDKSSVFIDGKESALHVFSARPAADAPVRRYYQVSGAAGTVGYTFTGSFPLSVPETQAEQVKLILGNVTFVDPSKVKKS